MRAVVAADDTEALVAGLIREGVEVIARFAASAPAAAADGMPGPEAEELLRALADADALVLEVGRTSLSPTVVALCDRAGTRIVPLVADEAGERLTAACGLEAPLDANAEPWRIAEVLLAGPSTAPAAVRSADMASSRPRVIAVWGPAGAPGRTTVATELAMELARGGRHVALVDADTHAPSIALALGLADEGPGFAAACRQAELGGLDARELTRIATPLGRTGVDVLTGINRPSRWPELSDRRVTTALAACREWSDYTVVDVASSLERDEEIVSDLDGPRRNAATIAALRAADLVVAVAAADPLGVARFLRAHAELRATIGATRVAVVANRLRPGALGIDARGQVRRTLDRFGGIEDVWFLPQDPRSADAALLSSQTIAEVAPKSPLTLAIRRFAGDAVVPAREPGAGMKARRPARTGRAGRGDARQPSRAGAPAA
ncbi:AAA family ATPase [Microbacterium kyungheense]|uniref:MinD-like ATPase involved in chromosome partitioning or flagellar assembly n=1 Tax=Microbacterium kyungheense TaxID=1263636 RepID=A0A543FLI8_9MICO|nr:P-loop NTPase [Microbacterium kyungheense]TQM34566.1 MinD-like ATPase involved in chromosome partitioning or flagellar assembly [Microbacterium kyungheense]